jgi:hypothetical protein
MTESWANEVGPFGSLFRHPASFHQGESTRDRDCFDNELRPARISRRAAWHMGFDGLDELLGFLRRQFDILAS